MTSPAAIAELTETETTKTTTAPSRTLKKTEAVLSEKTVAWCRKVAGIAANRVFRVKELSSQRSSVNTDTLEFGLLPKIFHRKRVGHTVDGKVLLHPEFFDEKGNIRKKLPKDLREELKAAIFKEIAHNVSPRVNVDFYKVMVRCPWAGSRVDGAKGSTTAARELLADRRSQKQKKRHKVVEVPTGLTEDANMYCLTCKSSVLVKDAAVFLADDKIKILRGECPNESGRQLRTMRGGGAALREQLQK